MCKSNIPLCEMDFNDLFAKYEVTIHAVTETLWGDEVPAYLAGYYYGKDCECHWDEPVERLASLIGKGLEINYIPT